MIDNNKAKFKIKNNDLAIGGVVTYGDPGVTEALCASGFDFIWIDGEHGPLDYKDIDLHILATKAWDCESFVRVRSFEPHIVRPILDMDPSAIIFPLIKSATDARIAVESCKYPPLGVRGFGPRRANNYATLENEKYLEKAKNNPWVILQIEHIEAVKNLEGILNTPGIDAIIIGPNDLSGSMGCLGQIRNPEVLKVLDKISEMCIKTKIPFGTAVMSSNKENLLEWLKRGVSFISLDVDYLYLVNSGKNAIKNTIELYKNK